MYKMRKGWLFFLILCGIVTLAGCAGKKSAENAPATATISFALQPAPTMAQMPASTQPFPLTAEDSIFSALVLYRQQGFEAVKTTWLTSEFATQTNFADFLATTVNNVPTTPAALMGWEILKVGIDDSGKTAQGTIKALVKTSYQGGGLVCRWLLMSPPEVTGNHWRIAGNEISACEEGQQPGVVEQTPAPVTTDAAGTGSFSWFPCDGAPASGLQIGSRAYVNPVPPLSVRLRWEPGEDTDIVMGYLNPGEVITIAGGPSCASGHVYWKIHFKNELGTDTGAYEEYDAWIAEMLSATNYLLLPCPAQGACGGGFTPARTARGDDPKWLTQRAK